MANFIDRLFGPENATTMSLALGLLQPTRNKAFLPSLSNAGLLALQTRRQVDAEKRQGKLYELQLDSLEEKSKQDKDLKLALSKITEARLANPEASLGDLFLEQSRTAPSLLSSAIKLQAQEAKVKQEQEKTERQKLLGSQLSQMTDDPMADLLFESGNLTQGISALNRQEAQNLQFAKEEAKRQQDVNTALSVLGNIQQERDVPTQDPEDEVNQFKQLVRGLESSLAENLESKPVLQSLLTARKEEARMATKQQEKEKVQQEKELLGDKARVASATEKEIDEIKMFFEQSDKRGGMSKFLGIDDTKYASLDSKDKKLFNTVTANRVKTLMANGLDKNTAMKHALEFGNFSLLLGRGIQDLINLPTPTVKEIKELEQSGQVSADLDEKQSRFLARYRYLPGLSKVAISKEDLSKGSIQTKTNASPEDLQSLTRIRASGRQDLIQKAEQIFKDKYGFLP